MKILQTYKWWVAIFVVAILFYITPQSVQSATFLKYDFPYYHLIDKGVLKRCLDPGYGATVVQCWSKGNIRETCKALPVEEGYIDCKDNE